MAQHTCQVCGTVYDTAADCCPTCGNPLAMDICPEVPEAPTPPETPEIPEVPGLPALPAFSPAPTLNKRVFGLGEGEGDVAVDDGE